MAKNIVKSYCNDCEKSTSHDILAEDTETHDKQYRCDIIYQIVRCRGCETRSFRHVFVDIEAAYPTYNDQWEVPENVDVYPKTLKEHRGIENKRCLPPIVNDIYSEVLLALKEDANILAGLGLRASVEAVCNQLEIKGKDLAVRINRLATAGYISKNDAERLHGIRFMGNDAAHDIKKPKSESLNVALQIVEHLVTSVYILDKNVAGKLDTTTSSYDNFEKILEEKLVGFEKGDEYPIAKYLGRDLRRVKESIESLEQELISKISNQQYTKLSIGKTEIFEGSKDELQHFKVT